MKSGFETLPRPVQLGLFGFSVFVIGLLSALFYRAVAEYDVVVGYMQQAKNAYSVAGTLDRAGSEYTIRPDGAVLLPRDQAERLIADGITFSHYERVEHFPGQVALFILLLAAVLWCLRMAAVLLNAVVSRSGHDPYDAAETGMNAPESSETSASPAMPEKVRKRMPLLEHEHPQCIAVYLEQIQAEDAATMLEQMDPQQRMVIWERMVGSRACDPQLRTVLMQLFASKHEALQRRQRTEATEQQLIAIFRALPQELQPAFLATVRARQDDPLQYRLVQR